MPFTGLKPDYTISGYPEYKTRIEDLDAHQRAAFDRMARFIVSSLFGRMPVRAVLIVGHADVALRKPPTERAAFEQEVSQARADGAQSVLLDRIALFAANPNGRYLVKTRAVGIGSAKVAVKNAATEADMRKNRRVEFILLTESVGQASCACVG